METTIDLVIEGDLLLRFHKADKADNVSSESGDITGQKMPVFLSVFALAPVRPSLDGLLYYPLIRYPSVFQLAMALDAVYARNTLQFFALT